jgi:hypothetical protein
MTNDAWLVCNACGLRHTARPDGLCPRCRGSLLDPVDAPSAALRPSHVPRTLSEAVPASWRIAGAGFLANGVLGALSLAAGRGSASVRNAAAGAAVSALVSLLLGWGLLKGRDGARKAALALAFIALAAGLVLGAVTHVWLAAGLIGLMCAGYILLLTGEPGPGRVAAGSVVLAAGVVAGAIAATNPRLVARELLAGSGVIHGKAVGHVAADAWSLTFPPDLWYPARAPAPSVSDVSFERQFLRPEGPAHAIVVSVKIPANRGFDMDKMADAISKATRRQFEEWDVIEVGPLPGRGGTRVLHVRATLKGEKLELLCGLFPNPPAFYEVVVGAERSAFAGLRPELQAILESFRSGP